MQVTFSKSHYCFALCLHVWPLEFKLLLLYLSETKQHVRDNREKGRANTEKKKKNHWEPTCHIQYSIILTISQSAYSFSTDWETWCLSVSLRAWCCFHQLLILSLCTVWGDNDQSLCTATHPKSTHQKGFFSTCLYVYLLVCWYKSCVPNCESQHDLLSEDSTAAGWNILGLLLMLMSKRDGELKCEFKFVIPRSM